MEEIINDGRSGNCHRITGPARDENDAMRSQMVNKFLDVVLEAEDTQEPVPDQQANSGPSPADTVQRIISSGKYLRSFVDCPE